MLCTHGVIEDRVSVGVFRTEVRLVDNALLQVVLTARLIEVLFVVADTARGYVLIAVPTPAINAFGTISNTDCARGVPRRILPAVDHTNR
jgi:hypothetical protein